MQMYFSLLINPVVYANTTLSLDHISQWTMGVLGLTTLMLVFYLLIVIFQPERF
ncbi:MAG: potassium-transporting ATPase subunit F [Cuspidothrix sp.]